MLQYGCLALVCASALSASSSSAASGQASSEPLAVRNARIYPVTSPVIESGTLLVRDGKIAAMGVDVPIPPDALVIDAAGRSVMPGIVESHSHMGFKQLWNPATVANNNELSTPVNAQARAIDGLNTNDAAFAIALAGGVTTMNITTGSRSPNSGQAVVVKLRGGAADDMFLAHGGMKFAIRATEKRPNFPESDGEVKELLRSELLAAREYLERMEVRSSGKGPALPPSRDLKLEALGKLLTRAWVVGVHAHTETQMRHAIGLAKEFDLDLFLIHADATDILAEELVAAGIPISFGPVLPFMGREYPGLDGPVRMAKLGGRVSLQQDHPDGHQYYLRSSASLFVRKGMPEEDALRALTLNPASLIRLENRIGSLEPGKDADFVILGGPPLEVESLVEQVFIDGKEVFNRSTGLNVFGSGETTGGDRR